MSMQFTLITNIFLTIQVDPMQENRAQELVKIAAKGSMFPVNMPELVYEIREKGRRS